MYTLENPLPLEDTVPLHFEFNECKVLGSDVVKYQVVITEEGRFDICVVVVMNYATLDKLREEYPSFQHLVNDTTTWDEWRDTSGDLDIRDRFNYVASSIGHEGVWGPIADPIIASGYEVSGRRAE